MAFRANYKLSSRLNLYGPFVLILLAQ